MEIKKLPLGPLETNCYIVYSNGEGVVIDPAANAGLIINTVSVLGIKIKYIVLTHAHFDHMGAAEDLLIVLGARLVCHEKESGGLLSTQLNLSDMFDPENPITLKPDILVREGDFIEFGGTSLKVIATPGHTVGGISLQTDGAVFSGDTLFCGSVGRSDFPGGDPYVLNQSIKEKLFTLPDETAVYPGHGNSTTIEIEKRENFYVR